MNFVVHFCLHVWIGATIQKQLDEIERTFVARRGNGGRQSIPIGDGQVQRSPAFHVRLVQIAPVIQEKSSDFVMTVLNSDKERTASVHRSMSDIRARTHEYTHRL